MRKEQESQKIPISFGRSKHGSTYEVTERYEDGRFTGYNLHIELPQGCEIDIHGPNNYGNC